MMRNCWCTHPGSFAMALDDDGTSPMSAATTQRQSHGPGSHCDAALGDVTEAPSQMPARSEPAPLHWPATSRCTGDQPYEPYRRC